LPQSHALEVMVAELLRPMLRRWLDENMPRLVSAALKAELALMAERESKKH
jgi:cell pole-organizing protein PopZ